MSHSQKMRYLVVRAAYTMLIGLLPCLALSLCMNLGGKQTTLPSSSSTKCGMYAIEEFMTPARLAFDDRPTPISSC